MSEEIVKSPELPKFNTTKSETGPEIAHKRRLEIVDQYVKKRGIGNARTFTKQIAEKYKIGERQVRKDFQWIKGNIKPEDTQQVKLDLKILRDKTLNLALLNIEAAASPQERNDAIKTAWTVIEKYRQDLEEWGEKEKVAEKHDISMNQPAVFNLVTKSAEEIKSGKSSEGTSDKPQAEGNTGSSG
jgi:hypothetical protein